MKRYYIGSLFLFLLSSLFIVSAHLLIYGTREDISLEEQVLQGDRANAEGLEIKTISAIGKLNWTGRISYQTGDWYDFNYRYKEPDYKYEHPNGQGISMIIDYGLVFNENNQKSEKLKENFKESVEDIGYFSKKTVNTMDYYRYYPIFPASIISYGVNWSYNNLAFMDYFKIPVLEDEEIVLYKDGDRVSVEWTSTREKGESYKTRSQSVIIGDYAYFTFNTHRKDGRLVDTSKIKNGYGIYRMDIALNERKNDENSYKAEQTIERVVPLNPEGELIMLKKTEDESRLVLFMREEGKTYLYLFDIEGRRELQKLYITNYNHVKANSYHNRLGIGKFGDIYLVNQAKGSSKLLAINQEGLYQDEGIFPVESHDEKEEALAYKDGKLAFIERKMQKMDLSEESENLVYSGSILTVASEEKVLYKSFLKSDIDKIKEIDYSSYFDSYELEWRK